MKKIFRFLIITLLIPFLNNCQNKNETVSINHSDENIERNVDSVLALMSLKEKIGQMNQYNGSWDVTGPPSNVNDKEKLERLKNGEVGSMLNVLSVKATREAQKLVMENSRLKIPLIFGYDVIHGYKTIFPIPLGESASWDLEIIKKSAAMAASETSAAGVHWTFAPMIDISRDARWGRIMEGSGEDPYLTSKIAVARIQGFQGDDLSKNNTIAACAKHYAGYGFAEAGRDYNTVSIGEFELHNTILPPFKASAESGVATFMNSFNEIDGIPATGHKELQRTILKDGWKWDGVMVSDWGSIGEMIAHGYAKDKMHAAEIAANAGSDMDMESYAYEVYLEELVKKGTVDITLIDDSVKRILRLKFKLGLFDDPYKYCNEEREKTEIFTEENRAFSREVAKRSIVLLKNENNILPLDKNIQSIAVIGPLADDKDSPIGNWRAMGGDNSAISLLEGIKNAVGPNTKITYQKGGDIAKVNEVGRRGFLWPLTFNENDKSEISAAVKAAKNADIVVLAIGELALQTGEGRSQTNIGFLGIQQELLEAVYEVNKNLIIVLMNGRPMDISWAAKNVPSILECWHLGSESGNAIADVLFGDYNPSGKLPVSFPHNVGQEPLYYNQKMTGRPFSAEHVTFSGYRDAPKSALYPFGYGLSYTTFEYKNLKLDKTEMPTNGEIEVSVDVTNIGDMDGEEVVQLYIRDLVGSITRPIKELKGFEKIAIKTGETKIVTFTINAEILQFYTVNKKWEVESGDFDVWVGGDSDTRLKSSFKVSE
jgi:beta-glucosidase